MENEVLLNWQIWSVFPTNFMIQGGKNANLYLVYKQLEKTMFMLLIVKLM